MATTRFQGENPELDRLYGDLAEADLQPLWLQEGLLTAAPPQRSVPFCWKAKDVYPLAERARHLVPLERGGDRRVLMFSNPGMDGRCMATSTMSAAIQILGPGEIAPAHRHTAAAIRFILEGSGAVTLVDGDSVPMIPGDLVLTPNWTWHEHHNPSDERVLWLDVLDLALVIWLDAMFFEPGPDDAEAVPPAAGSVSERRYGRSGIVPVSPAGGGGAYSPLFVYRWSDVDAVLRDMLGDGATQHASVRYTDPVRGGDVMPTLRCEAHRLRPGSAADFGRATGSAVWTVFAGEGSASVGESTFEVEPGDTYVVPSWSPHRFETASGADLFTIGDAPVFEALGLMRRRPPEAVDGGER